MDWEALRFALRDLSILHIYEGLHLCEQDSTVWIHFRLFEILMLRWVCALSSCICRSVGEEEWMVTLSIRSRLAISVRLGIMLGM